MNDKQSLDCRGTERQEGGKWGRWGGRQGVGWGGEGGGSAQREGVFVCDGQKGGRAWEVPEQSGC